MSSSAASLLSQRSRPIKVEVHGNGGRSGSESDGATRRVLVVDDNLEILEIINTALSAEGYRVQMAENGRDALEQIEKDPPQLILLDMRMPVMDGWQFVREFRNRYGRLIPIVVITAAEDSKLRAEEVGADGYLGKPFEIDDLYETVANTILD